MKPLSSILEPQQTLPHSFAAEQALLGGLLQDSRQFDQIADRISVEDFYHLQHRLIFEAIAQLMEGNGPCDVVTVSEWLKGRGLLEKAGGYDYLVALVEEIPLASNLQTYADLIREKAILRALIETGGEIAALGYHPNGRTSDELLELAERKVFKIADIRRKNLSSLSPLREVLKKTLSAIEERYRRGSGITGIPTGFYELDEKLAGLQRGDLIIIAGRPSMGKTSFALNIAHHVALKENLPVLIFSLEMPADQIALRLISQIGHIDQQDLRTGRLKDQDWSRLVRVFNQLAPARLFIDDVSTLTPMEMRARARRLVREHGELGLIVVDYLQLMHGGEEIDRRVDEVGRISRGLKMLAKELNVPVIALSQLNRNVEQRQDKRPVLSDLRESGSLEQDADVILFIYREEVYRRMEQKQKAVEEKAKAAEVMAHAKPSGFARAKPSGFAEIIIGKQRNGPIGTVKLKFLSAYTSFENLEERLDPDDCSVPAG